MSKRTPRLEDPKRPGFLVPKGTKASIKKSRKDKSKLQRRARRTRRLNDAA